MSKNKAIQDKLESRSPATMRQLMKPIDMLESEQKQQPEGTNEATNVRTDERTEERMNEHSNETTNERKNERSSEQKERRTEVHSNERTRVRHSFDIFQDQLDDLREFALRRQKATRKRVLLGDLVQEALDAFIEHERVNERSKEHKNE